MKDITPEFKDMIIAFGADFSLATLHDSLEYVDFRELIKSKNERLLKDIDLLQKLEFGIRYGRIKIFEVEENENISIL